MIIAFFKSLKRKRLVAKLADIESRRKFLRDEIASARKEQFKLDAQATVVKHELRML